MQDSAQSEVRRLTIYLGEDKVDVDQPLFRSIVQEARAMHIAGVTVMYGSAGFGRSTRLHTADVLFSTDLPVVIEIVDTARKKGYRPDDLRNRRALRAAPVRRLIPTAAEIDSCG
jgi:PII-like signaling protein